jgi:TatD DNase family protein
MIDFHCHLDLYPNHHEVRQQCDRLGMYVLSVTTTPYAWKGTSALAEGSPRIRTALGLHPQLAGERKGELPLFDALLPTVRYIGEIGLDGTPEFRKIWNDQVAVFEHILAQCAKDGGRVMSIHSRRASGAVLDYLERFPEAGRPVLHWFSGSFRDLDRAINLGCWFSIGPAMLAGVKGRELVRRMPRERILTESDGPFARVDGAPALPWHVETASRTLAEMWSASHTEVKQTLIRNLADLLGKHDAQGEVIDRRPGSKD